MKVEVIYAQPTKSALVSLELPEGSTVIQAVEASGPLEKYPEIDVRKNKFGVSCQAGQGRYGSLRMRRVEIYRPLIADPKEVRKQAGRRGQGHEEVVPARGGRRVVAGRLPPVARAAGPAQATCRASATNLRLRAISALRWLSSMNTRSPLVIARRNALTGLQNLQLRCARAQSSCVPPCRRLPSAPCRRLPSVPAAAS